MSDFTLVGVSALFASALGFSLCALLIQIVSEQFSPQQIMGFRSVTQLGISLIGCCMAGVNPLGPKGDRLWVQLRGILGAITNIIFVFCLSQLPLSDANALFFTQSIFTAVFAWRLMGDNLSRAQVLALVASMLGAFFLARPVSVFGGEEFTGAYLPRAAAVALTLGASVIGSLIPLTVRKAKSSVHFLSFTSSFGMWALVLSTVVQSSVHTEWPAMIPANAVVYVRLFTIGIGGTMSQFLYTIGMQREKPAITGLIRQSDVLFACVWQWLIMGHPFAMTSIIGAGLIVSATSGLALQKLQAYRKMRLAEPLLGDP